MNQHQDFLFTCHNIEVTLDNILSAINVLATVFIGVWIGYNFQRNYQNNRAIKDYLISEINDISSHYITFFASIYKNDKSSKEVQEWFKIITIRLEVIECLIRDEFDVFPTLLSGHNEFKQFLTDTNEFNDHYNSDKMRLTVKTRNEVLQFHRKIKTSIGELIISTQRAKRCK